MFIGNIGSIEFIELILFIYWTNFYGLILITRMFKLPSTLPWTYSNYPCYK